MLNLVVWDFFSFEVIETNFSIEYILDMFEFLTFDVALIMKSKLPTNKTQKKIIKLGQICPF